MAAKLHRRSHAIEVPPALPADEAAAIAYEADQGLTSHAFTPGEHPIVRIEHLNKSFDDTLVLKDVNLNVWPGEVVVVLGPSGSGKSTMLRCINLLETPSAGHILIEDDEITGKSAADVNKLRRDVGMVFQQFNLFPHLTAKENVMIGQTKVLKKSREEAEAEAMKQLAAVGLADRADFKPAQLSGGQQQRIAIARAILKNAPILILDEATSASDPENQMEIDKAIQNLCKGKTVIVVAHRLSALKLCDRVAVVENHTITSVGTHEEVRRKNAYYRKAWEDYEKARNITYQLEGGEGNA